MDLNDWAAGEMTREQLVEFVDQLADSLMGNHGQWENVDLVSFLRALSAWTEDMDGYFRNRGEPVPTAPSWQLIAQMLLAARVYE